MAECSRAAGADREPLGRRGPVGRSERASRSGGPAGMTDLLGAAGRRVGVSDRPRSRGVGAHRGRGPPRPGRCGRQARGLRCPLWSRGRDRCFRAQAPLYSVALMGIGASEPVTFAGKHEFDPALEEDTST